MTFTKIVLLMSSLVVFQSMAFAKFVDTISMENCADIEFVHKNKILPRGSALITSSGKLAPLGITAIVHAGAASWGKKKEPYNPTLKSLGDSIVNSMILADRFKHKRVAIPLLGGGIFFQSLKITVAKLAELVVQTAYDNANGMELVFISVDPKQVLAFKAAALKINSSTISVVQGSIVNFSVHKASAIVNAGNMEMIFGTGLSGVIAKAVGNRNQIDAEAKAMILAL